MLFKFTKRLWKLMPLTSFNFLSEQYHEQIFSNGKRGNIHKYTTFQLYTKKKEFYLNTALFMPYPNLINIFFSFCV